MTTPNPRIQKNESLVLPPVTERGLVGWAKQHLFNSWWNSLLTLVTAWVLVRGLTSLLHWVFVTAHWQIIQENLALFMVGPYPRDQIWRIWLVVALAGLISGISWGAWGKFYRTSAVGLGAALLLLLVLPIANASRAWVVASFVLIVAGFALGSRLSPKRRYWLIALWLLIFGGSLLLIGGNAALGLSIVESTQWNGLLLTLLLTVSGIVCCFPLGVLLALGRRSDLPLIRTLCVGYIELVRGTPLIAILFMSQLIVPMALPDGWRPSQVMRAFIGITLFAAAYLAENVRGGLNAVSKGQMEAATALGLRAWQAILFIQLPQALRAVVPALVGQFISLLKDTSLVAMVNLPDIMAIAHSVLSQKAGASQYLIEVYLFVAFVYFVFSYSLSIASRRLERALGVGER